MTATVSRSTRSTRAVGHFVVDAVVIALGLGLSALVLAAAPAPEVCALSLPTPGPCFAGDRDVIALVAVISVALLVGVGVVANHLLHGRARRLTVTGATVIAIVVGLLGASSLHFSYWIIHPFWQL